ncbi:MAG: hypothetical protein DCC65_01960 [Planctomycetota bacterium]|nr:MAG: hypothetical protein DCC65_01960 [Planctomycetota bacterium]
MTASGRDEPDGRTMRDGCVHQVGFHSISPQPPMRRMRSAQAATNRCGAAALVRTERIADFTDVSIFPRGVIPFILESSLHTSATDSTSRACVGSPALQETGTLRVDCDPAGRHVNAVGGFAVRSVFLWHFTGGCGGL